MDRNFALFQLAQARPDDHHHRAVTGQSFGAAVAMLVLAAIVIAALAIPFISG